MFKSSSVFSFFPKRPALHEVTQPNTFFKSTSGNALKSPKFWVFLYLSKSWAASKNLTPTVSRSVIFCAAITLLRMSVPGLWSSYRIIEKGQCPVIHRLTVRHPWAEIFLWFFQLFQAGNQDISSLTLHQLCDDEDDGSISQLWECC